ncbi:MAG: Ig domain-containing protein [Bryobacterales bacterium]|nr:Ig domain-containing protein [Bryobacterales bacterium]
MSVNFGNDQVIAKTMGNDAAWRGQRWLRLLAPVWLLLFCAAFLPAQGVLTSLFPDRVAQGYAANTGSFTTFIYFNSAFGGVPTTATWVNGPGGPVPLTILPTPSSFFAEVTIPVAMTASLGLKEIQLCRPEEGGNVCTNVAGSVKLSVVAPQVTSVAPAKVTQGVGSQTVSLEYLLPRSDNPVGNPTVYLVDSQGQETLLTVAEYFFSEGGVNERYVDVTVPASVFTAPGTLKFRVVETFNVNGALIPLTTNSAVAQATMEVVPPAQFVTASPLPPAQLGPPAQPYTTEIEATGGSPYPSEGGPEDGRYEYYTDGQNPPPAGLFLSGSFSRTATLSGTPTGPAGKFSFTVYVSDRFGVVSSKVYRIGVQTPATALSISTATLPQGRAGQFYLGTVAASGGIPSYEFSLLPGGRGLPAGLELEPDGDVIGVPTNSGTFIVDVRAEDSQLRQAVRAVSVTILPAFPPVLLTSASPLPPGRAGTAYSFQFNATGGLPPYTFFFSESGNPPPGLTLSFSGLLSGTPTTAGTYQFGVGVADSRLQEADTITDFRTYTLVIEEAVPPPQFLTEALLPMGEVGTPYSTRLETTGGVAPVRIVVGLGLLPAGLLINENTGVISGTPTNVGETGFLATVVDARGREGTRFFRINVVDERLPLSITTASPLPNAGIGEPYSTTITATGGLPPYAFAVSAGTLPPGMTLNPQSGAIVGTATQAGNFTFTVRVSSSAGEESVTREFQIQVLSTVRLITQSPLPDGLVGTAYSATIVAERGTLPYQFSVIDGQLPNGLTLNASTGTISGTPTAPFSGSFTLRVRDAATPTAEATRIYQIRILQPLELTVLQLPSGTVNVPYQLQFGAQGGVAPYTFSLLSGTLPSGVTLSPAGLLSGTATAPSTATLAVQVADAQGTTTQRNYPFSIQPQAVNGGSLSLSTSVGVSNTQNEVDVNVSAPQPDEITGSVTLTLNSATTPPVDDPAVQFIGGGRTASFTIPAGQTSANFGAAPTARFQTGTTAATLVFTAAFRRNGQDVTPDPAPLASLAIPVTPPTLTDVNVARGTSNLTIVVRGFAPERNITTAVLEFTRRAGTPGANPERFDVNVSQAFQQWFGGAASQPFGSQFRLTIPVTLTGDPADITGVTVRLTGPSGTGNSITASF